MRTQQSSLVEQLALARKERLERTKHRGQQQELTLGTTSERGADGEVRVTCFSISYTQSARIISCYISILSLRRSHAAHAQRITY